MKEKHKFNFFPEISAEDSKGLRESIAKGFDATLGKITLYEGKVLDGWNRYKACIDTGIEPVFTNFYGNDMEAFNFSVNANLDRRHLTSSQKAAMAVNAEPLLEAIEKANEEERRRKQAEAQRRIEAEKKAKKEREERERLEAIRRENARKEREAELKRQQALADERRRKEIEAERIRIEEERKQEAIEKQRRLEEEKRSAQLIAPTGNREEKTNRETRTKLADAFGTNRQYISDVKKLKESSPELYQEVLSGKKTITEVKKEEKKRKFEVEKKLFQTEVKSENLEQKIILGDSIKVLPTLEPKSFDLLLSDPPYGMDFKSGWNTKDKIANDKIEDTVSLFEDVLRESVPLLKDDAHFYLFGNINYITEIKPIVEKYLNLKSVLIWDRKVIGMGDLKSYGNSYDIIYFGYNKVWKDLNGTRDRDLLSYSRVDPAKNIHPTEKPLDILEYLIKKSSNEKDKVLEPFAGGGSTLLACKNLNRLATGIEIEEKYYNLIKERI